MGRRRRRWTLRLGLVVILAAILGWQGLGLLPSRPGEDGAQLEAGTDGGEPARDGAVSESDPPAPGSGNQTPATAGGAAASPGSDRGVEPGSRPASGVPGAADGGAGDGPGGTAPRTAAPSTSTEDPPPDPQDQQQVLYELIREAVATGRLGDGFLALQELEAMPPVGDWQTLRNQGRQDLGDALTRAVLELRAEIAGGSVLDAAGRLAALRGTPHPRVMQALNRMASGEGWGTLGEGPVVTADVPEPRPLGREREVRAMVDGEPLIGRVADSDAITVTLRLRRADGVVFPTLPRTAVEPVGADAAEAVAQGFAALRVSDRGLAWLWMCRAHAAGGTADEALRTLGRLVAG